MRLRLLINADDRVLLVLILSETSADGTKQVRWPSGLRRCVQVAVNIVGVGSNPTLINLFITSNEVCAGAPAQAQS